MASSKHVYGAVKDVVKSEWAAFHSGQLNTLVSGGSGESHSSRQSLLWPDQLEAKSHAPSYM